MILRFSFGISTPGHVINMAAGYFFFSTIAEADGLKETEERERGRRGQRGGRRGGTGERCAGKNGRERRGGACCRSYS